MEALLFTVCPSFPPWTGPPGWTDTPSAYINFDNDCPEMVENYGASITAAKISE